MLEMRRCEMQKKNVVWLAIFAVLLVGTAWWFTAEMTYVLASAWQILQLPLVAIAGFFLVLFVFPLVPGAVDALTNRPNRFKPSDSAVVNPDSALPSFPRSTFGFFTYLQPGRAKIVERGHRFMRVIMRYEGHMFEGERDNPLTTRDAGYWQVVELHDGDAHYRNSHPIPFPGKTWKGWRYARWCCYAALSIIWWSWKLWVYQITGAVFTGIYPFQKVRVYPLEYNKKVTGGDGKITIVRVVSWSDHFRVADSQMHTLITEADTRDKIPVRVLLTGIVRTMNPYEAAYHTDDDWGGRMLSIFGSVVTMFTRPRPLDDVLSADDSTDSEAAAKFAKYIKDKANEDTIPFGMRIESILIPDISPSDPEIRKRLGDLAVARVDRDARLARADGEAGTIAKVGAAIEESSGATLAAEIEGRVRTAGAAGAGAVVMVGGSGVDTGTAALLNEIRRLREGGAS
jgi:regulator of protease activity HflC (stomatin/prohibitin superfamily)